MASSDAAATAAAVPANSLGGGTLPARAVFDYARPGPAANPADPVHGYESPLTNRIYWARNILHGTVAVFFLLAFNGVWRIGRDSALYRGLARNLAEGNGYTFGELAPRTLYPGYPLVLAALEKLFGPSAVPPLVLMYGCAAGILFLTYKLVRLHYPAWIALTVTLLMGLNGAFIEFSNEILADVPFLLGLMMSLYGWERFRLAHRSGSGGRTAPVILLISGLIIAASTRPTFWILALAWAGTCVLRAIKGPERRSYIVGLSVMLVVATVVVFADASLRGVRPFSGGYETDAVRALGRVASRIGENLWALLSRDLLAAFLGNRLAPGVNQALAAVVVVGTTVALLRRGHVLWALLILGTVAVTLVMTTVPRYYLMVLPLMLLGWVLLLVDAARRVGPRWGDRILLGGLLLVLLPNLGHAAREIANQRWRDVGRHEKWAEARAMSESIRDSLPPDAKIIGPDGSTIMSYYSRRQVMQSREVLPLGRKHEVHWPRHVAALGITHAVFPSTHYVDEEHQIKKLMDRGVIVPGKVVGRVNVNTDDPPMVLAEVRIVVPPDGTDWRKQPRTRAASTDIVEGTSAAAREERAAAAERKARKARQAYNAAKRAKAEREARLERQAAKERKAAKARKAARAKAQAERSAPAPTPAPTTQPRSAAPQPPPGFAASDASSARAPVDRMRTFP